MLRMDKERDAHREFSFLFIPFISVRCSALLLVVISANRFDIRAVMVLSDFFYALSQITTPHDFGTAFDGDDLHTCSPASGRWF